MTGKIYLFHFMIALIIIRDSISKSPDDKIKKKKDIRDYTDAEIEKLYDQWEENDEIEHDDDEVPQNVNLDMDSLRAKVNSPDELLKMSKKGQSVMMFVSVSNPNIETVTKQFTEEIASKWQANFYNNHIDAQNYIVADDRILFLFKEGSQAWDARDFVLQQQECKEILLEGKSIKGPASKKDEL